MSDEDKQRSELDALGERLARAKGADADPKAGTVHGASAGDGLRIAIEFVVSVLVGSGLGYLIGGFFGSAVIGLLIGMPFGFAAGLRTVYRGMAANKEKDVPDGDH